MVINITSLILNKGKFSLVTAGYRGYLRNSGCCKVFINIGNHNDKKFIMVCTFIFSHMQINQHPLSD